MVEKWDSVADTLPQIVERLQALSSLHEQGELDWVCGCVDVHRQPWMSMYNTC